MRRILLLLTATGVVLVAASGVTLAAKHQFSVTAGADVDCGAGVDTIHYDKGVDKIHHCEVKVRTAQ